ncbi:MAG: hypothetical protein KDD61_10035 [Bdellovibrionales bacterium]|nr:hypothetical protein [Bdellovibrionales bacterium]
MKQLYITVKTEYPSAIPIRNLTYSSTRILQERGFTKDNTLFATSLCRDELNQYSQYEFYKEWGLGFQFGGLAGFPTCGEVGLGAFADHIPDQGKVFVFYGSHIGLDESGHLGELKRPGQTRRTVSCGSLARVFSDLKSGSESTNKVRCEQDFLYSQLQEIINPNEIATLTFKDLTDFVFDHISESLKQLLEVCDPQNLALLGGVLINTGRDEDFFVPKEFVVSGEDLLPLLKSP